MSMERNCDSCYDFTFRKLRLTIRSLIFKLLTVEALGICSVKATENVTIILLKTNKFVLFNFFIRLKGNSYILILNLVFRIMHALIHYDSITPIKTSRICQSINFHLSHTCRAITKIFEMYS